MFVFDSSSVPHRKKSNNLGYSPLDDSIHLLYNAIYSIKTHTVETLTFYNYTPSLIVTFVLYVYTTHLTIIRLQATGIHRKPLYYIYIYIYLYVIYTYINSIHIHMYADRLSHDFFQSQALQSTFRDGSPTIFYETK